MKKTYTNPFLLLFIFLTSVSLVLGCGSGGDSSSSNTGTTTETATELAPANLDSFSFFTDAEGIPVGLSGGTSGSVSYSEEGIEIFGTFTYQKTGTNTAILTINLTGASGFGLTLTVEELAAEDPDLAVNAEYILTFSSGSSGSYTISATNLNGQSVPVSPSSGSFTFQ